MRKSKCCTRCGKRKKLSAFSKNKFYADGLNPWCKTCVREYRQQPGIKKKRKQYYQQPVVKERQSQYAQQYYRRPEVIARIKVWGKIWYIKLKIKALTKVAKLICELCGETDIKKLTIDHRLGDGDAHRVKLFGSSRHTAGVQFYRWVLRATQKQIKDANLRILCKTCNNGTKTNSDAEWLLTLKKRNAK